LLAAVRSQRAGELSAVGQVEDQLPGMGQVDDQSSGQAVGDQFPGRRFGFVPDRDRHWWIAGDDFPDRFWCGIVLVVGIAHHRVAPETGADVLTFAIRRCERDRTRPPAGRI